MKQEGNERVRVGDRVVLSKRGKKGLYVAEYSDNGQHRRASLKTTNRKTAIEKATKLAANLLDGMSPQVVQRNVSLADAIEAHIKFLETEHRARKTIAKVGGILRVFQRFVENRGTRRLSGVAVATFDALRVERGKTLSPKSMFTEGVIIKGFLKWCVSRKLIPANPLSDVHFRKPVHIPRSRPSLAEVDRILAAAKEPQRTMLAVLAFTGMRVGQLRLLRPSDIDLVNNWITIRPVDGAKTRVAVRVPIHPRLRAMLSTFPAPRGEWFFSAAPSRAYPNGGNSIKADRLNDVFKKIATRLGLPVGRDSRGYTLHGLRGFFETFCNNNLVPQRAIDCWLGHRSDQTMAAVYYKLSDADSQRLMQQVPFGTGLPAADAGQGGLDEYDLNPCAACPLRCNS